jgi:nucleoid-associated protein YejK
MIRNVYSTYSLYHSNENKSDPNILSSFKRRRNNLNQQLDQQSSITYSFIRKAANRKRLRIEYRFAKASICLVSAYIFAWTPYALIAFLQLFHMDLIFQQAFFITLSAMIAKLSVILAPIVYLGVMNFRLFKKIFFNKKK